MSRKRPLQVGDIITSRGFAYGSWGNKDDKVVIFVDGETIKDPVIAVIGEDKRLLAAAKAGKPKTKTIDLGAYDSSRGIAKFVIEETKVKGESYGHGPNDVYPGGFDVLARRLNKDGTYNSNGEYISIFIPGCFDGINTDRKSVKIVVVGRMQRIFVKGGEKNGRKKKR